MTDTKFCSCKGKIVVNFYRVKRKCEAVIYNEHKISKPFCNNGQFRIWLNLISGAN